MSLRHCLLPIDHSVYCSQDVILAELMSSEDWIVDYHEHDSLLENRPEENLSEEERKSAWEEYEKEKAGFYSSYNYRPNPTASYANYNNTFQYSQYTPPELSGALPSECEKERFIAILLESRQFIYRRCICPPLRRVNNLCLEPVFVA